MSTYRDGVIAAYERIHQLEAELQEQTAKLTEATERARRYDAVLERLGAVASERELDERVREAKKARRTAWTVAAIAGLIGASAVGGLGYVATRPPPAMTFEQKAAMTPADTTPPRAPMSVVIAIDGRTGMAPNLDDTRAATLAVIHALRDDDSIAIVSGKSNGSDIALPLSTVREVRARVPEIVAGLTTATEDDRFRMTTSSSIHAAEGLLSRTSGDARIVAITDGHDGRWDLAEGTAGYLAGKGLRVSAIGVGQILDGYPQSIARTGLGHYAAATDRDAMEKLLRDEFGAGVSNAGRARLGRMAQRKP